MGGRFAALAAARPSAPNVANRSVSFGLTPEDARRKLPRLIWPVDADIH
jgi:hypothetical protein